MDARVGDRVVTPRIGKPVEVQALWLNALHIAGERSDRWSALAARGRESFAARFWNEAAGALHDVVDVDHRTGTVDATIRPKMCDVKVGEWSLVRCLGGEVPAC
jgi:predicted glycogen debranching enzyme